MSLRVEPEKSMSETARNTMSRFSVKFLNDDISSSLNTWFTLPSWQPKRAKKHQMDCKLRTSLTGMNVSILQGPVTQTTRYCQWGSTWSGWWCREDSYPLPTEHYWTGWEVVVSEEPDFYILFVNGNTRVHENDCLPLLPPHAHV